MVSKVERLSITIPTECAHALNERAASDKANKSAVISTALKAYLSGAYIVDVTESYSNNDTKIGYLEHEITLKDEIIRRADAEIATYRALLGGAGVKVAAPKIEGDAEDTQDKKPGALGRFGAWLRRA